MRISVSGRHDTPCLGGNAPSGKAQTPKKETRTTAGQQASTTGGEHLLLADRLEIKNRLSKEKQRREADLKAKKQNEDLEAPLRALRRRVLGKSRKPLRRYVGQYPRPPRH